MESLTQTKKEWQNSNYLEQNKKIMESLSELSKQCNDEITKIHGQAKTLKEVENDKKSADKKDEWKIEEKNKNNYFS